LPAAGRPCRQGDEAARIADEMKKGRAPVEKTLAAGPVCHQTDFSAGISPNGLKGAAVMEKQLEGLILLARRKTAAGIALLEQAAAQEDAMAMDFGPPNPVKPAHELLGEALIEQGKLEQAAKHFELALQRAPGRRLSLEGLAKAKSGGVKVSAR
jgi:tetratricopeptide (TPR) repeat protein